MQAFYCHHFVLPLPVGHRFPMDKYARLHARVAAQAALLGIDLCVPQAVTRSELLRAHEPGYVDRVLQGELSEAELRRIGFPWSPPMVERSLRSSGATVAALRTAIEGDSVAVNLAGGTHHATAGRGGGYCVFNDSAIAARAVQAEGLARRLLVVDLDVHQGDGTAAIFAADASVFTFSMHAARNYPAIKPPSDLDVPLPDGCDDGDYLAALDRFLPEAIERARPDAVIYLAGADPFAGDRLGYLALSKLGLAERDRRVLLACRQAGLPLAISMAGGYAEDVDDIVDIHFATVEQAARFAREALRRDREPPVRAAGTASLAD
jgi:acetoin utilization deacetylase AcuC-like enzyme